MFEQLDQPHQAGREVGVSKSHRKKKKRRGEDALCKTSYSWPEKRRGSDSKGLVERFPLSSQNAGSKRRFLSLSFTLPAIHVKQGFTY